MVQGDSWQPATAFDGISKEVKPYAAEKSLNDFHIAMS